MRYFNSSVRGVFFLLAGVAAASAAMITGVQSDPLLTFGAPNSGATSFQAPGSTIAGAGVYIDSVGGPATASLSLSIATDAAGSNILASQQSEISLAPGAVGQYYDLFFGSPLSVTPGTSLFLLYDAKFPAGMVANVRAGLNTYGNGMLYTTNGAQNQFDLAFQILTDDGSAPKTSASATVSAPVVAAALSGAGSDPDPGPAPTHMPEPSTVVLLGAGLAAFGLYRRR